MTILRLHEPSSFTFEGRHYDVCVCDSGHEALELWQTEEPDLILLDVQLPDMDGPGGARARQERRLDRAKPS